MSNNLLLKLDLDADWRADWDDYTVRIKNVLGGHLVDITDHLPVGWNGHIEYEWKFNNAEQRAWWMAYANFYLDVYYKKKRVSTEIELKEHIQWDRHSLKPSQRIKDGHRDKGFKSDKANYDKQISVNAAIKLMGTKGVSKSTKKEQSKTTTTQKISDGVEKSGIQWVSRYPNNNDLDVLVEPVRTSMKAFITAMKAAGISVQINVVYRPVERSYLMYYSTLIHRKQISPLDVPPSSSLKDRYGNPIPQINIDWVHMNNGKPDLEAAQKAASDMAKFYAVKKRIAKPGRSNHIRKGAVDMVISKLSGKSVATATGKFVVVHSLQDLDVVGSTYGVRWNGPDDSVHWSRDGN